MRKVPRNEEELIIKQNSDLFTRKFKRKLRKALLSIKNPPLLKRCTNVFTRVVKCKTFSLLISVINNLHLSQKIQVFTLMADILNICQDGRNPILMTRNGLVVGV